MMAASLTASNARRSQAGFLFGPARAAQPSPGGGAAAAGRQMLGRSGRVQTGAPWRGTAVQKRRRRKAAVRWCRAPGVWWWVVVVLLREGTLLSIRASMARADALGWGRAGLGSMAPRPG